MGYACADEHIQGPAASHCPNEVRSWNGARAGPLADYLSTRSCSLRIHLGPPGVAAPHMSGTAHVDTLSFGETGPSSENDAAPRHHSPLVEPALTSQKVIAGRAYELNRQI